MISRPGIDLQLFAEEKRLPATPRRRQLAKEKGQVFSSQDLVSAVSILFTVLSLRFTLKFSAGIVMQKAALIWASIPPQTPDLGWAVKVLKDTGLTLSLAGLPVMITAMCFGAGASLLQVGFMVKPNLMSPDLNRLNPLEGFKRIFSRRSMQTLVKSVMKIILIGFIAWHISKPAWPQLSALVVSDLAQSIPMVVRTVSSILLNSSVLLVGIGVIDYLYQWWEHEKNLKMTYQEVKEELKDIEGKPEVRQAIRQRQRQIATRRMMQDVPSADVVLVNPSHCAVALRYRVEESPAPKVVAKGLNDVALRIKSIALENKVHIVENPPLARALYHAVDVGELIPEELYQAVAQVLAHVYRLSGTMPLEGI